MMSSCLGSERASGSARATSCPSAASVCGATRIERSGTVRSGYSLAGGVSRVGDLVLHLRPYSLRGSSSFSKRPGHQPS